MNQLSRRKFLKAGAAGVALVTIPAIFRTEPLMAFVTPSGSMATLNDYYTHFGIDENMINGVMGVALERGGDYCDIFFEHTISNIISLEDNIVNKASARVDLGVGIRVINGDQTGYSFTEEISPKAMKLAARTAANIANQDRVVSPVALKPMDIPDYYPIETACADVSVDKKIPILNKINDKIRSADKRIVKAGISFRDSVTYILIATSDGRIAYDFQPMTRCIADCTAEQDGQRESNYYLLGGRYGIEFYTPETIDKLATEVVDRTVILFDAVKPEGGEMEVVLAPGSAGIILHEAIGHGMEADFNRKGESLFADKTGKKVASEFVSIVDDGTIPHARGSINIDDEANPSQKTYLVENGILKMYMHDYISAKHYGVQPTGNGRRQSFRHAPVPRMRNTYMLPGPHTREEVIGSVKKGLYAKSFTNGEVNIGPGDFTFYLKTGYLIEDGKLTRPVKDVNIIGNGFEVLKDIVMVADDLEIEHGGGTCGKSGQWMPVTDGLPTSKVSSITVGGVAV